MKTIVLSFVSLLFIVTNSFSSGTCPDIVKDDIREAVFRHEFAYWREAYTKYSPENLNQTVFFLSVEGADPTAEFMNRFVNLKPVIKAGSNATTDKKGVKDKETGQPGVIFHIRETQCIADNKAEVKGGHYEHGLSASGNTYYLRKKNGKWQVIKVKTHWQS